MAEMTSKPPRFPPIHQAAWDGDVATLQAELDNGVAVDLRESSWNLTPLMCAVSTGRFDACALLIEGTASVNAVDKGNWTPLMKAADEPSSGLKVAKLLLEHKASWQVCGYTTVLHNASSGGNTALVKLLLEHDARVDINRMAADDTEHTPLMSAAVAGAVETVKILLANKADPTVGADYRGTALQQVKRLKRKNQTDAHREIIALLTDVMHPAQTATPPPAPPAPRFAVDASDASALKTGETVSAERKVELGSPLVDKGDRKLVDFTDADSSQTAVRSAIAESSRAAAADSADHRAVGERSSWHEKALGGWTRLPAVLVAHAASFVNDAESLAALQSSCKAWHSNEKLDSIWRALYLEEFEPESANDDCIAVEGETTPWRKRFSARSRVENNWRTGRVSSIARGSFTDNPGCVLIARLQLVVFDVDREIVACNLSHCKEVRRWSIPAKLGFYECLCIDESQSQVLVGTGCSNGDACVWDASTGKQVGVTARVPRVSAMGLCAPQRLVAGLSDDDQDILICGLDNGHVLLRIAVQPSRIRTLTLSRCARYLFAVPARDDDAICWRLPQLNDFTVDARSGSRAAHVAQLVACAQVNGDARLDQRRMRWLLFDQRDQHSTIQAWAVPPQSDSDFARDPHAAGARAATEALRNDQRVFSVLDNLHRELKPEAKGRQTLASLEYRGGFASDRVTLRGAGRTLINVNRESSALVDTLTGRVWLPNWLGQMSNMVANYFSIDASWRHFIVFSGSSARKWAFICDFA